MEREECAAFFHTHNIIVLMVQYFLQSFPWLNLRKLNSIPSLHIHSVPVVKNGFKHIKVPILTLLTKVNWIRWLEVELQNILSWEGPTRIIKVQLLALHRITPRIPPCADNILPSQNSCFASELAGQPGHKHLRFYFLLCRVALGNHFLLPKLPFPPVQCANDLLLPSAARDYDVL